MARVVRCAFIQASNATPATEPLQTQKQAMVEKHLGLVVAQGPLGTKGLKS